MMDPVLIIFFIKIRETIQALVGKKESLDLFEDKFQQNKTGNISDQILNLLSKKNSGI